MNIGIFHVFRRKFPTFLPTFFPPLQIVSEMVRDTADRRNFREIRCRSKVQDHVLLSEKFVNFSFVMQSQDIRSPYIFDARVWIWQKFRMVRTNIICYEYLFKCMAPFSSKYSFFFRRPVVQNLPTFHRLHHFCVHISRASGNQIKIHVTH